MADLKYISDKTQFTTRMGDDNGLFDSKIPRIGEADADIKIGGDDPNKFQSEIRASKWGGEYELIIRNPLIPLRSDVKSFDNGIITIEDATKGIQERYFATKQKNPSLEYEMIFASQPSSEIRLNIEHSDGLEFFWQDIKDFMPGSTYAPNVPGSYAVYIPESNNEKRTGKFCHFYKPEWVDAVGRRKFVEDFQIDNGQIIIVSGDWVKTAVYPIILDPVIGWETQGASNFGGKYFGVGRTNTGGGEGGTISTFHWYIQDAYKGRLDGKCAVYDGWENGANRISNSVTFAAGDQTAGWNVSGTNHPAMTGTLTANSFPAMAVETDGPGINFDSLSGDNGYDQTFTFGDEMSNPLGPTPVTFTNRLALYVTYAAAAGGVVPYRYYYQG